MQRGCTVTAHHQQICNQHQAVLQHDHTSSRNSERSTASAHSVVEYYLDVCPPQQGVSNRSKPQSLCVVGMSHIVQHALSGHAVDGQAQCQPTVDDQGEHTNPDGQLQVTHPCDSHWLHTSVARTCYMP